MGGTVHNESLALSPPCCATCHVWHPTPLPPASLAPGSPPHWAPALHAICRPDEVPITFSYANALHREQRVHLHGSRRLVVAVDARREAQRRSRHGQA